ncbi:hypothetical protein NQ315_001975 [Exocentrus adspersus]|uniref:UDP-glycosyltransferases domain-containing protein n=1 Tax=Exocentrus adspersus TaxID=1586481 RepID=A0AAV8W9Z5_9CUCU|nr:hypothetical protein NQ315_001975 [Exocentrus adspersus]
MKDGYKFFLDISKTAERRLTMWNFLQSFNELFGQLTESQLAHPKLQELIHDRKNYFDVVLVEGHFVEFLIIAEIYKCPSILVSSLDVFSKTHSDFGNAVHPVLYPDLGTYWHMPLTFSERVESTIYSLYSSLYMDYIMYPTKREILRKFFNTTITIKELINNVDMLFLTVNPIVQGVRAVGPTTVNIPGVRPMPNEPLPKDLQDYLDSATNGFVYFSLGSNVKSKDLQVESRNAIIEALGELPYKVLWKFEADEDTLSNKPSNVKLIKWAPQIGVLGHSNIKTFVTQGGLQSMEEAIHKEVPCVVIPFFGDQMQNARRMRGKGIAVTVGRHPFINKEELKIAILEVINNPNRLEKMFLFVLLATVSFPTTKCANILAWVPTPSYSHQVAFHEIWKQLSLRGHQVTLITTNPLNDPKLINLTEIDMSCCFPYLTNVAYLAENVTDPWEVKMLVRDILENATGCQILHPTVREIVNGNNGYDVILIEYLSPYLLALGRMYNCPTILFSSMDIEETMHQIAGNPTHPISHPNIFSPYFNPVTLSERIQNTLHYWYNLYSFKFIDVPFYGECIKKYFNVSIGMEDLLNEVSLFFINSHPVIHGVRAVSPTTIFINHQRNSSSGKLVDRSIMEFMDNAKQGFIYFSFGTNVKSSQLSMDSKQTILQALKELNYKVLYKYEADVIPGKPDNILLTKWVPQQEILRHPNIKVFVTQGGRQSTEEAVYAAVPMVVIPYFYDQEHNANLMKARGVAQVVRRHPLVKDKLYSAIKEVFSNSSEELNHSVFLCQRPQSSTRAVSSGNMWPGVFYVLLSFAYSASCGNILVLVPAPFYSHQIAFTQIWKELSLRGHQVTLMTTVPHRDPALINLTEIDTSNAFKIVTDKYQITKTAENVLNMWNWYDIYAQINRDAAEEQLSNPKVQDLIHKSRNYHFDVVFVESYYAEFLAFGKLYNCPTVLTTSVDGHTEFHHAMGNPAHPILHADYATPFHGRLNFRERVVSTIYSLYVSLFETLYVTPGKQRIIDKYFTNMSANLRDLIKDVDMMFLDVNPVIQDARAIGPTTINIGMERNIVPKRPLTKDLKDFMDNATEGFMYFSLGSNVRSKELNPDTITALVEAFREVPYKVVWKFEGDDLPGKPDNVKLVKWAPQQVVLKHPNIKLFITQGGLQSMEEAIYSKVPMVVIPFFFDQFKNARLMEIKQIGKTIGRKPSVNKDELKNAIMEVITDPKYINSVRRLGRLAKDLPLNGLQKAIWWTEYIIRNKGAKHLRNPAADIPFYQYFLLDVISFLVVVTVGIFIFLYVFVKKSVQVVRGVFSGIVIKTKKLE